MDIVPPHSSRQVLGFVLCYILIACGFFFLLALFLRATPAQGGMTFDGSMTLGGISVESGGPVVAGQDVYKSARTFDPCTGHGRECCAQLAADEPYSRSCQTWAERFYPVFPLCCGSPSPTVTPSPSCETEPWLCPEQCASPTPGPTPEHHEKGKCCRDAQAIYWAAVRKARAEAKSVLKAQMKTCREGYQHPEPAPW